MVERRWLAFTVEGGVEPGFFKTPDDPDRSFGWRTLVRGVLDLNIRSDDYWLYWRTTALYRHRGFEEDATFRELVLDEERSVEQATAVMRRVADRVWVYGEYTVGYIGDIGVYPNRPSAGVVVERWPWPETGFNLDVYYSLVAPPLDGLGGLLVMWCAW